MPLYEYECSGCAARFERRHSVHEDPLKVCPACGAQVRRLYYPVGIIFKGSGFYTTDYRRPMGTAPREGSSAESVDKKPATAAED